VTRHDPVPVHARAVQSGIASALQAATNGALTLRSSLVTALLINVAGTTG
jgi:hypothetical protein